jgi:hypothetical protein
VNFFASSARVTVGKHNAPKEKVTYRKHVRPRQSSAVVLDKGFGNCKQRPCLLLVDIGRKDRTKAGFVSDRTGYVSPYQVVCSL